MWLPYVCRQHWDSHDASYERDDSGEGGSMSEDTRDRLRAAVIPSFAVCVVLASIWQMSPPAPLPANADPREFSAARAAKHVAVIAATPHPMGSDANARARQYLVTELQQLGLEVQTQTTLGVTPRFAAMGVVTNVVGRLRGLKNRGPAVLLVSHYDSQPVAPGAGDDAHGVAAILETVRALSAGPRLRNDIVVLFTDGEEDGLLGASAFVDEHPWASDVSIVVNFEGRGDSGPSVMFETGPDNGWLIRAFRTAVQYPSASSVSGEVYRRMPNDTDFTIFKRRQFRGMNFAHLGGWQMYHTPLDLPANLDASTLQHHGTNALGLARYLGDLESNPSDTQTGDAVYFSLPLFGIVVYSIKWTLPLAWFGLVLFGIAVLYERRQRGLRIRSSLLGIASSLASIAGLAVFSVGLWVALMTIHHRWLPDGDVANSRLYAIALINLVVALHLLSFRMRRRWLGPQSTVYGAIAPIAILGLLTALVAPGATYILVWPLLFGLASTLLVARFASHGLVGLLVLMVPTLVILAPMIYWLVVIFGVTGMGAPAVAVQLALMLEILLPQLEVSITESPLLIARAAAAAGVLCLAIGMATVRFTPEHPRATNVFYTLDADTSHAVYASPGAAPDVWSQRFLTGEPHRRSLPLFFPAFFTDRPDAMLLPHEG